MCHSQIEGDKDEQDRDEQEMKEREIFGSSSLSKLRQKNRLIFVFMLKALKYFGLSVSRIVLWDFLEKPWTSSAASSYAILSLLIVLISTATFIISTFEARNIVSTALLSHYCHLIIVISLLSSLSLKSDFSFLNTSERNISVRGEIKICCF